MMEGVIRSDGESDTHTTSMGVEDSGIGTGDSITWNMEPIDLPGNQDHEKITVAYRLKTGVQ